MLETFRPFVTHETKGRESTLKRILLSSVWFLVPRLTGPDRVWERVCGGHSRLIRT